MTDQAEAEGFKRWLKVCNRKACLRIERQASQQQQAEQNTASVNFKRWLLAVAAALTVGGQQGGREMARSNTPQEKDLAKSIETEHRATWIASNGCGPKPHTLGKRGYKRGSRRQMRK